MHNASFSGDGSFSQFVIIGLFSQMSLVYEKYVPAQRFKLRLIDSDELALG